LLLSSTSLLALSRDAHAFCRTRTDPVSSDDCAAVGPSLYWKNQCVGYALNQAASKKADLLKARAIVATAFAAWTAENSICTPGVRAIELNPTNTSTAGFDPNIVNENVIVFRDASWPYHDAGNPLALTTVTFNADTGEILDADIEVNTADPAVTAAEPLPASGYDLQSIITHEVGHFLGLAHSHIDGATMEARYDRGQTGLRTLEVDDQEGICTIYPTTETRTTDKPGDAKPAKIVADQCDTASAAPPPKYDDKGCSCVDAPRGPSSGAVFGIALLAGAARARRRRRV
jgi:hypothetical protein